MLKMRLSAFISKHMRAVPIVAWVTALGVAFLSVMLWQNWHKTRAFNQQKITAAIEAAVAGIQEHILVVEMTAQATEHMVRTIRPDSQLSLRTMLETAMSAFEQSAQLSHLGLSLPETGAYGSLERTKDGGILLWLYPDEEHEAAGIESLKLTQNGFVPVSSGVDALSALALQRAAHQTFHQAMLPEQAAKYAQGAWQLRSLPQMAAGVDMTNQTGGDTPASLWRIGYSKAFYDEEGHFLGLWDANFDASAIQSYVNDLQSQHGIGLSVIELGDTPKLIDAILANPQPVPDSFTPLLEKDADGFVDTMQIKDARHWVAARTLTLKGDVAWLVVATRKVSLLTAVLGGQMWYMLMIAAGTALVSMPMMHRTRRIEDPLPENEEDIQIEHPVLRDDLTGLINRAAMEQVIDEAIEKIRGTGNLLALIYLDLDRFRAVNDSYGYLFGNVVLKAAGEVISRMVRPQDTVAYLGGDRFLILLDGLRHKIEADRLVNHIIEGFKHPLIVQDHDIHLSASMGVSIFPHHGITSEALINSADIAMAQAKKMGRDTYQFFTPALGRKVHEYIELENQLRYAIEKDQLHMVYQPKVSLHDGTIMGCEALLRWTHPELGEIPPSRFIPIAENSGLILPIGDWVLTTVCHEARGWLDDGLPPVRVAVNLSMRQFLKKDVVAWVSETLRRTGLPVHCLELELTESLLPQDMDKVITTLNQLDALGVKLSLDDFGTGYSNLTYLKRLRLHMLKIDQAFVRGTGATVQDGAIIRTVVNLAHSLKFRALAEGVETQEQLNFLREQNCDEIQGYYFSRPVPAETYAAMLREGVDREWLQKNIKTVSASEKPEA